MNFRIPFCFWVLFISFLMAAPPPAQPQAKSKSGIWGIFRRWTSDAKESSGPTSAAPFILVLDAGHGGRDSGSKGPGSLLEKKITLQAAKLLVQRLKRYPEIKIVLTRDSDTEITAVHRAALANHNGAALMVSIHADASWRPNARGASILVAAPQRPPRVEGEAPQAVALRWQRGQNVYLADSGRFAKGLQNRFAEVQKGEKPPIRSLTLLALEGARVPAAYVSIGVISTPEEAAWLRELKIEDPYLAAIEAEIIRFAGLPERPMEEAPASEEAAPDPGANPSESEGN